MSTTDNNEMKSYQIFRKKGDVLECPITGGEHRAASGNISILVSGNKKSFKGIPILSKWVTGILWKSKNASILKVITNYLASLHLLGIGRH